MELLQPETLETLAITRLGDWIALQAHIMAPLSVLQRKPSRAKAMLSQHIENIRNQIECKVPKTLHDKFAIEAIRALKNLWNQTAMSTITEHVRNTLMTVTGRMIETLFIKNLTSLAFNYHGMEIFHDSLNSKIHMLSHLTDLKLNILKETDAMTLLKKLPNLKYLYVNICTDNILRCIAKNCKLIEELDLKNCKGISDNSMDILIRLLNLRSVELYGSAVTEKGIATLLLHCKNIENIGAGDNIGRALHLIASSKKHAEKEFKLKTYKSGRNLTLEQLQIIVKMCPLIEKTIFYKYELRHTDIILGLIDMENLRELQLVIESDFHLDQVTEMLQVRGRYLVELCLYSLLEIDLDALMFISQICPNLQGLKMKYCQFLKEMPMPATSLLQFENAVEILSFKNLKRLSLDALSMQSKPTDDQLIFLLSNCPNVEYIYTGPSILITDDIMLKVLDRNPLIHLKEFKMAAGELTMAVLDRIIISCIKLPKVVISK